MTMVTPEDKAAMARILQLMNGTASTSAPVASRTKSPAPVELAGAGQVTRQDVDAMAQVLNRLNSVVNQVSTDLLVESQTRPEIAEALNTTTNAEGVKIGLYQIRQNLDESLLTNKQNFSVINKVSGETIAHDLGLYEAAHALVKMLNSGKFVNSPPVRELLDAEATYTAQKVNAARYNKLIKRATASHDVVKIDLFESRKQKAMDLAMQAKATVKKIYSKLP